jgi:RNA polymerase sigma-70 factor (ECF subfamily)
MNNSLTIPDKEFLELYERNIKRIYQICFMHLKNQADAEDAVQTVFLKYLKSEKKFIDDEHEKAWFIKVAQNHCRDVLRYWWRSHQVDIENIPEIQAFETCESALLLEKLLELPRKYKDILFMYYFEGYSVKEISKHLHRNESTIRTQLSKGRERLKINIGGYYER